VQLSGRPSFAKLPELRELFKLSEFAQSGVLLGLSELHSFSRRTELAELSRFSEPPQLRQREIRQNTGSTQHFGVLRWYHRSTPKTLHNTCF